MNRREAIAGAIAASALPVLGQTSTGYVIIQSPQSLDERKRQYAICKERGHQGEPDPTMNVVLTSYPPQYGPIRYKCKFCGTTFWTETVAHESGAPE